MGASTEGPQNGSQEGVRDNKQIDVSSFETAIAPNLIGRETLEMADLVKFASEIWGETAINSLQELVEVFQSNEMLRNLPQAMRVVAFYEVPVFDMKYFRTENLDAMQELESKSLAQLTDGYFLALVVDDSEQVTLSMQFLKGKDLDSAEVYKNFNSTLNLIETETDTTGHATFFSNLGELITQNIEFMSIHNENASTHKKFNGLKQAEEVFSNTLQGLKDAFDIEDFFESLKSKLSSEASRQRTLAATAKSQMSPFEDKQ